MFLSLTLLLDILSPRKEIHIVIIGSVRSPINNLCLTFARPFRSGLEIIDCVYITVLEVVVKRALVVVVFGEEVKLAGPPGTCTAPTAFPA